MGDGDQTALNALAKGAGLTAIGMLVSKVLAYAYRILIARFVGPDAYGQLSLALMVIGIGSTLAYLSLGSGLKKFIPEFRVHNEEDKIRGIVLSVLHISLPLSIIITSLIFFGAEFIAVRIFENTSLIPLLKILSFSVILSSLSSAFFDTTIGFNKIIYYVFSARIVQNIVQFVITLALLLLGFRVVSAAWGWLAGTTVAFLLGIYFMEKKVGPVLLSNITPEYQYSKLLKFSGPLVFSGIIATLMGYADTGLLGYYMTDFEVGLYNAALPTAVLILLPHKAIGSLALTSFSELKERNEDAIQDSIQTATYWVFSLVFPTFLIMLLFSNQILLILFGSEYTAASTALTILAVGYLVDALVGRVGSFLQSQGRTKYILYNSVAALILNLVLNVLLIPIYGIIGAAIATSSSIIFSNILMFLEAWKKENMFSIPKKVLKISLAALTPLLVVVSLDHLIFTITPFWFIFPAAGLYYGLYIAIFLKMIGFGKAEKEIFRRLGERIGRQKEMEILLEIIEKHF